MTTSTSSGPRLPGTRTAGKGSRLLVGLLAVVGTFLVVVGLPLFLLSAFGTPWPDTAPSVEWLTRPLTTDTVLSVLAAVVWLAWAHFLVCLAVETVAEVRHRGVAPRVPGGGIGTQQLARRMVAAILLLAGTAGVSAAPAMAASTPATSPTTTVSAFTTTQLLGLGDTAPAAHTAGGSVAAGSHSQADQHRLPAVDTLQKATRTDVHEGATTYYDVKPPRGRHYDTLWDMADRYLGNGLRYKEIWELNKDVVQPDGRVLKNPDLIYPGWVMKLPADAVGPGLKVVDHATLLTPGSTAPTTTAPATAAATAGAAQSGTHGADVAPEQAQPLIDDQLAPWLGVSGGLAFAGLALALRRRRTSGSFGRLWATRLRMIPGGPGGPDGGPDGPQGGRALALESGADVSTASWLAAGLRAWNRSGAVPVPSAVTVADTGAAVGFDEQPVGEVPSGWERHGPKVWTLDRDADVQYDGLSPLPGLVSIGRRPDGSVAMVDPESVRGLVALEGEATQGRGLAVSMAVDTATHPWADQRVVTMVGFADDLSSIAPDSLRHTHDVGRVLESLENLASYQRAACRKAGAASVRVARSTAPDAAAWVYHLVVCSGVPTPEDLQRLSALAADPQVALGVVVVGSVPDSGMRLTLRDDGRLVAPVQGLDLTPQLLTAQAARELTAACELGDEASDVTLDEVVATLERESDARLVDDALVRVSILGPVHVDAPGPVEDERRELLTELACLLALHPDGLHVNRISAALWPRGVDSDVFDATMAQLAAWFGPGPDDAPVLRQESGVWSVTPGALSLDWAAFRGALNRSASQDPARESQLRLALDLVRGPAFADVPGHRFGWLPVTGVVEDITLAVGLTAATLAEIAADRGDVDAAVSAAERGLELLPANEDLWCSRLLLARRFGSRTDVEDVAARMYDALDGHGSPIGATARTDSLVADLLPGWTRRVA